MFKRALVIGALSALPIFTPGLAGAAGAWQMLAPGLALNEFAATKSSPVGNSQITVLRIDPARWELEFIGISRTGDPVGATARQWSEIYQLTAVINAGMFAADYKTHIGFLKYREHINNGRSNHYQSVAAFDPRDHKRSPLFRIFDLDVPGVSLGAIREAYGSAMQNLRLVKRPGENRWNEQGMRWSEAALGEDKEGRILFIFCRSPYSMHDLNKELLTSDIGLVAAQHLEGGPEAQLYLHIGETERELFGSYETSFREDNSNALAWPVPNVLGIRPRPAMLEQHPRGQGNQIKSE